MPTWFSGDNTTFVKWNYTSWVRVPLSAQNLKTMTVNFNSTKKLLDEIQEMLKEENLGEVEHPRLNHEERFLNKLKSRAKKFIDLTPYFIKLIVIAVLLYIVAIMIWYDVKYVEHKTIMDIIHMLR